MDTLDHGLSPSNQADANALGDAPRNVPVAPAVALNRQQMYPHLLAADIASTAAYGIEKTWGADDHVARTGNRLAPAPTSRTILDSLLAVPAIH